MDNALKSLKSLSLSIDRSVLVVHQVLRLPYFLKCRKLKQKRVFYLNQPEIDDYEMYNFVVIIFFFYKKNYYRKDPCAIIYVIL